MAIGSTREFFEKQFDALDQSRITSKRVSTIGKQALDARTLAQAVANKASNNPHLNEAGKRAARQEALRDLFVENERGRLDLDELKTKTNADIDSLALPSLGKDDIVGEMREAEARSIVRAMPQEKRDSIERLPASLAAAVVRAPAELSGVSPSVHKMLRDQLVETAHSDKIAALRGDLHGIELAQHVVKEAHEALRSAAQFEPGQDREYMDDVRRKAGLPKERPAVDPNDLDALIAARRRKQGTSTA
jgi:hypothetical protein